MSGRSASVSNDCSEMAEGACGAGDGCRSRVDPMRAVAYREWAWSAAHRAGCRRGAHTVGCGLGAAPVGHQRCRRALAGHPSSGGGGYRTGVLSAQRDHGDGHRAGRRRDRPGGGQTWCRRAFPYPSEVKAAVTGNGSADKAQVTAMVTKILALQAKPTPADAADALALAICHCWRAPTIARMAEATSRAEARAAQQRHAYLAKLKAAR